MERLLHKQLSYILDVLFVFFAVITVPGVILSLSRISAIGFRPEMYFHIILTFAVIALAVFRKKIPFRVKAVIAVVFLMIIGYSGLFSIGLSSSARLDIAISIALACLFFNLRTGVILGIANSAMFAAIAVMNANGTLNYRIDFNAYNYAAKSWAAATYNFTAMGVVVVLMSGLANQQLRKYLNRLSEKKKQLHKEITQRKIAEENYKRLSRTDPLTELFNRRYFFEKAEEEMVRAVRYGRALSIIMVDADFFKTINDTYGHRAGDFVLKMIAERFHKNLRPVDVACRFGGEEFCILLPETDFAEAVQVAERLRRAVSSETFDFEGTQVELTCSFGVTEKKPDESDISPLISRADEALYNAKDRGRNTITSA